MKQNLAFIGAGNMGSALISALLENGLITSTELYISDRNPERLENYAGQNIHVATDPAEIVPLAKYIVLAIKPQDASETLKNLRPLFKADAVLISIAAGRTTSFLREQSGVEKIVRVMPNTPAMVARGVSGMYPAESVSDEERAFVKSLFAACGEVIECLNEEQIDAITALSGSGPAYYFRILEIIAAKAIEFGFSKENAKSIALQTLRGAGEIAYATDQEFQSLREMVTSKGGTTAAALETFANLKLEQVIDAGIDAAFQRAKELRK